MYSTKRYLHQTFIYLFIILFTIGINPSIALAGRTPAKETTTASTTPLKKKKTKKKRKNKRTKAKHKRIAKTAWYSYQTIALLGILFGVGATFMWLFGLFSGFPIIMFIGLGILFILSMTPLALSAPREGIATMIITAVTIGLFLVGFLFGSWILMIIMMVLLLLLIILGLIITSVILGIG